MIHIIKKIPFALKFNKFIKLCRRAIFIDPLNTFYNHYPHSAGDEKQLGLIALKSLVSNEKMLADLFVKNCGCKILSAEELLLDSTYVLLADKIGSALKQNGSDKSTKNNYHYIYAYILKKIKIKNMIEIGLGSNNPEVLSNMGVDGVPGASLRAFKEYVEDSIIGLDFDKNILFSEHKIKTYFVDQLDRESFENIIDFPEMDLCIDDGLHVQKANLNSLDFFLKIVAKNGFIVIEDIPPRALDTWIVVKGLLENNLKADIIKCKKSYAFLVENIHGKQ